MNSTKIYTIELLQRGGCVGKSPLASLLAQQFYKEGQINRGDSNSVLAAVPQTNERKKS